MAPDRERARRRSRLLRLPSLRRYLLGQTLSAFGDSLMPIALVFAVLGQGGSATAVGLVLLASRIPSILIVLLGGAVGDRLDRRKVMLVTDAARCALQTVTGALLLTGHTSTLGACHAPRTVRDGQRPVRSGRGRLDPEPGATRGIDPGQRPARAQSQHRRHQRHRFRWRARLDRRPRLVFRHRRRDIRGQRHLSLPGSRRRHVRPL